MQQFITDRLPEIEALCRTHHVQRFSIFGSAVRNDFNPETSDVDVRVIFDSEKIERYARNAFAFQDALVALFGRQVGYGERKKNQERLFPSCDGEGPDRSVCRMMFANSCVTCRGLLRN